MGLSRSKHPYGSGKVASRVVVESGPMRRAGDSPSRRSQPDGYVSQPLPVTLGAAVIPPWAQELSRLLARRAATPGQFPNLRSIEHLLRMPGASLADLPDTVIRSAGVELKWLARHDEPSPALARLLDQFEHQALRPALRRLQKETEGQR